MPRLLINSPGEEPRVFELPEARPVQIGRSDTNDVVLRDSSVSRRHASLLTTPDGGWKIQDLDSANGVVINGKFVKEAKLKNNDQIAVGVYTLRYEELETQRLVAHAMAKLPARVTQVLSRPEVELVLAGTAVETVVRRGGLPPGIPERRANKDQRLRLLEHENHLLTLLYQVNRALGALETVDEVVSRVLDLVLQIEGVERGYAMLLDERGEFLPAVVRFRHQPDSHSAPAMILSQSIIRKVMDEGIPLLVEDARVDERFAASRSLALSGMQSALCAPLRSQEPVSGLLYVDNLSKSGMFTQEDLNVFAVIAAQAGLAIAHVRARQEVAKQIIQRNALERFLSPSIAKKIVAEAADLRLGGETQKVTAMFADIRGFTKLAESIAPTEVVELLNEYFNAMTELIFQYEGTLDKYLGDGLMCLFGAPFSGDQDAYRAVRTAIDMQLLLREANREARRHPLQVGIGINTGPVVAGYIGAARRLDYTAIGDTVNVAARLTGQAQAGQILVSAATFEELAGQLPGRELPPMKLRGRDERIQVYEILWEEFSPKDHRRTGSTSLHL
jgi:adenylate cyclase